MNDIEGTVRRQSDSRRYETTHKTYQPKVCFNFITYLSNLYYIYVVVVVLGSTDSTGIVLRIGTYVWFHGCTITTNNFPTTQLLVVSCDMVTTPCCHPKKKEWGSAYSMINNRDDMDKIDQKNKNSKESSPSIGSLFLIDKNRKGGILRISICPISLWESRHIQLQRYCMCGCGCDGGREKRKRRETGKSRNKKRERDIKKDGWW